LCVYIKPVKQFSRNKQIATNKINTWSVLLVTQKLKGKGNGKGTLSGLREAQGIAVL
jgi:hypothetical protein